MARKVILYVHTVAVTPSVIAMLTLRATILNMITYLNIETYFIIIMGVAILLLYFLYLRLSCKLTILQSTVNVVAKKLVIVHGRIDNTLDKIDSLNIKKKY